MKAKVSIFLLALLPIISFFLNVKIYWAFHVLLLVCILIEEKVLVVTRGYYLLSYLGIPLVWTLFFSLNDQLHFIIQALFYLATPLVFTFVGMQYSRIISPVMLLKYIVYSGTIGSLIYIGISFYHLGLGAFFNPYEMRDFYVWGSATNVMAIIIMLFSRKYDIVLFNKKVGNFVILINLMALYFTASRTYYLAFLVFMFIFLYEKNKKIIFSALLFLIILFGIVMTSDSENKLIGKFQSTGTEITLGEYDTAKEINNKYRGFETFMAYKTYISGTSLNLLFGHGFEKQVDLGVEVLLGDEMRSLLPWLHNGYMYQLLKEGLFGLILFLLFFIRVIKLKSKDIVLSFCSKIILGSIITLMISNFVICTFFSIDMSILWVFLGMYIVYVEKEKKINKELGETSF
ncbi:MAG: hypothetical protein ACFFD1_07180 [Candidatus Thorarchaeota archaeon]